MFVVYTDFERKLEVRTISILLRQISKCDLWVCVHKFTVELRCAHWTLHIGLDQCTSRADVNATSNGNAWLLTAIVITSSHPRQRNIFVGGCVDGGGRWRDEPSGLRWPVNSNDHTHDPKDASDVDNFVVVFHYSCDDVIDHVPVFHYYTLQCSARVTDVMCCKVRDKRDSHCN